MFYKDWLIPFPRTHTADAVPLANCGALAVTAGTVILAAKTGQACIIFSIFVLLI